jgi:hypothetical protein
MKGQDRKPTFQETRKLFNITRSHIARITGLHVDELWALEETGKATEETWKSVIDAFNRLAKTGYTTDDFSNVIITNRPIVNVE